MSLRLKHGVILVAATLVSTLVVWSVVGMPTVYQNYDGPFYIAVARSWYDKQILGANYSFPVPLEYYPAHFPGYPLLINLGAGLGLNRMQSMLTVTILTTIIGAISIYYIFNKLKWGNPLWIAIAWLFLWPRMWGVRVVGSPEPLFITVIIWSLFEWTQKRYWLAALWGAAAVITKSPGILLLAAFGLSWIEDGLRRKRWEFKAWPVLFMVPVLLGVFGWYKIRTGDFWAYFHSGDNIHLQLLPFKVFDSNQPWVGNWWLEDVIWIYFISAAGVVLAFKKNRVWGWYGAIFLASIIFVSHRDISRYSLPLVPVVLLGLADIWERKEIRWIFAVLLVPLAFFTINFLKHNLVEISNWAPFI